MWWLRTSRNWEKPEVRCLTTKLFQVFHECHMAPSLKKVFPSNINHKLQNDTGLFQKSYSCINAIKALHYLKQVIDRCERRDSGDQRRLRCPASWCWRCARLPSPAPAWPSQGLTTPCFYQRQALGGGSSLPFITGPLLISCNKQITFLPPTWYAHKQPGTKTRGLAYAWGQKPAVAVHTAVPRRKCSTAWTSSPWSRPEVWHIPSHPRRCCRPRTCVNHIRGHG